MTKTRQFPFGGVPVYNPQSLSKGEALAQFHARQSDYEHLMALLREERPPHVLIIGTRGMGKTTMLQRVRYGVEDDPELHERFLVLVFPEEQYNVSQLHRFYLNTVDAVADALERIEDKRSLAQVEAFVESLVKRSAQEIEEKVPRFLADFGTQIHKGFLLLVDNADRLFDAIEDKQQWRLRELLSSRSDLTFYGATTQASDGIYHPERAFYEFFQIQRLMPLTLQEVRHLLLKLSESVEETEAEKGTAKRRVAEWLEADSARLRTLVQLTGGNPRTTVLLFHLVLDGLQGGAREYLEQLLDQVTPGYKGRVDDLPPQTQQVLDAVALHWDPVTAHEVASESGLETSTVSTQLTRLVRQGILEKADPGDSKRALYQVSERFFNIWYLMRASRRLRAKLRWFVEFLRVFFGRDELEQLAWEGMERFRFGGADDARELENAVAFLIASSGTRQQLEEYLRQNCLHQEQVWMPVLELLEPESRLGQISESEVRELLKRNPEDSTLWIRLGMILAGHPEKAAEVVRGFRKAVNADSDLAGALAERVRTFCDDQREFDEWHASSGFSMDGLTMDRGIAWYGWGMLLSASPAHANEAEAAFRRAIECDSECDRYWMSLGLLLVALPGRETEAVAAFSRAAQINPNEDIYWLALGTSLMESSERANEAENAIRKAIELAPSRGRSWFILALLLSELPERAVDAELSFRRAVEIEPENDEYWARFGVLLARLPGRAIEAERVLREAIRIGPDRASHHRLLGLFLACNAHKPLESKSAFRKAIELDPQNPITVRNLGVLQYCELGEQEEGLAELEKARNQNPNDPITAAIALAGRRGLGEPIQREFLLDAAADAGFWRELLTLCRNYAPFGKLLLIICDIVSEVDPANRFVKMYRTVALAQMGDFPRASVAFEDALVGDPIDMLSDGQAAIEVILAAAVRDGRTREIIEVLDKKDYKDAWRPIYEALRAAEAGSAEYLKRVAVELRAPALAIIRRIAPHLNLASQGSKSTTRRTSSSVT